MSSVIKKISMHLGRMFYRSIPESWYPQVLKIWFRVHVGYPLNLKHPQTYNEKIQWLKLYDTTPLKTQLADKYRVCPWVEKKIGKKYLIPCLGVWDKFDDIDFDSLPDQFVLKANHGSKMNIIVRDKQMFDKEAARKKFKAWMKSNFAYHNGLELQYKDIKPQIIAEKYMVNNNGVLNDYKVYCFNGHAEFIRYFIRYDGKDYRSACFDRNWVPLKMSMGCPPLGKKPPKPENLDELLQIAEVLSKDFSFVRVDFYRLETGEYKFGEMTFTPASGTTKWTPPENDLKYGKMIKLPTDSRNR